MRSSISWVLLIICALEASFFLHATCSTTPEGRDELRAELADRWSQDIHAQPTASSEIETLKAATATVGLSKPVDNCVVADSAAPIPSKAQQGETIRNCATPPPGSEALDDQSEQRPLPAEVAGLVQEKISLAGGLEHSFYFAGMPFFVDMVALLAVLTVAHYMTVQLSVCVAPFQSTLLSILVDVTMLAMLVTTGQYLAQCVKGPGCEPWSLALAAGCIVSSMLLLHLRGASLLLQRLGITKTPKPFPPLMTRPLPLVGHLLEFVGVTRGTGPLDMVRRGLKEHGAVFSTMLGPQKMTFLIGPEESSIFYRGLDKDMDQADVYKFMIPIFGRHVLYDSPLHERKQQLQFMSRGLLGTRHLITYVEKIHKEVLLYCEKHMAGDCGSIDLKPAMAELTILTASRALLGEDVREHCYAEMSELYYTLDEGLTPLSTLMPYAPIAKHRARDKARKAISELFTRIIKKRREEGPKDRNDLLQTLIDATYKDGKNNTDDQIVGIIIGTLFAGHHTSSSTTAWALMFVSKHPEILERILAELPQGWDGDTPLSYEDTKAMPYLHAVIKEALRMYPPLILLMRRVCSEHEVNGYSIMPGDIVVTSPAVSGHLDTVYTEPAKFDPDRFMPDRNEDHGRAFSYPPFGGGIHGCMGQQYAFLQLKVILATILRKYTLQVDSIPEPDYEAMVVGPKGKCTFTYQRHGTQSAHSKKDTTATTAHSDAPALLSDAKISSAAKKKSSAEKCFSAEEVAKHNTKDDAWIIVEGKVYDVTKYVDYHPGGDAILENVGYDSTEGFNGPQHPPTARDALDTFYIGDLQ